MYSPSLAAASAANASPNAPNTHSPARWRPGASAGRAPKKCTAARHRKIKQQDAAQLPEPFHRKAGDLLRRQRRAESREELRRLHGKKEGVHGAQPADSQLAGERGQPRRAAQGAVDIAFGQRRAGAAQRPADQPEQPGPDGQREQQGEDIPHQARKLPVGQLRPAQPAADKGAERRVGGRKFRQRVAAQRQRQQDTGGELLPAAAGLRGAALRAAAPPCAQRACKDARAQGDIRPRQREQPGDAVGRQHRVGPARGLHAGAGQHPIDGGQVPGQQLPQRQFTVQAVQQHRRALQQPAYGPKRRGHGPAAAERAGKRFDARNEQDREGRPGPLILLAAERKHPHIKPADGIAGRQRGQPDAAAGQRLPQRGGGFSFFPVKWVQENRGDAARPLFLTFPWQIPLVSVM